MVSGAGIQENIVFLFVPDSGSMSCASSLLLFLPLSFLSCVALADERARHPAEMEEWRAQAAELRREAKSSEENRHLKHLWRQLSHEERNALRQQMRANWEHMTPEERQKLHQAYRDMRQEHRTDKRGEGGGNGARQEERAQSQKARRKAHEAYWQSLPPAERKALRNALREALRHWRREGAADFMTRTQPELFPVENIEEKDKAVPETR
jgi:uncharacterized membrane protein